MRGTYKHHQRYLCAGEDPSNLRASARMPYKLSEAGRDANVGGNGDMTIYCTGCNGRADNLTGLVLIYYVR